jgi:two-component system sensor histidine kinase KdpD
MCMPGMGITHGNEDQVSLHPNPNHVEPLPTRTRVWSRAKALFMAPPHEQNPGRDHGVGAKAVIFRLTAVVAAIAGITAVCFEVVPANATTAGFSYLIAILFIATTWDLLEAIIASIIAALCFNFYFLPPVGALTITDPHNWVALFAFAVTSIVGSQLANRERRRAAEAVDRQREMSWLYALSRSILLADTSQAFAQQTARQIEEIFQFSAVALYDGYTGEIYRSGAGDLSGAEKKLRISGANGSSQSDAQTGVVVSPILLNGRPIGSLAVKGAQPSSTAMEALRNLIALGLERVRSQELATRAEAARQSDEIKSTLLDAIAHEFKTPLTSIKGATSTLLSSIAASPEVQRELVTIVEEEADRLSALVTEAIQMARIEAGGIRLNKRSTSIRDLVSAVLRQLTSMLDGRKVDVRIGEDLPSVCIDSDLIAMALRQLLDNAVKYSTPDTRLIVAANMAESRIVISVTDEGPGIPEYEQSRIFEKFYRSPQTRHRVPGTGMGLAIAREILRLHGGDITVHSSQGHQSEFQVSMPMIELDGPR